jgi:hypothetical protein
MHPFDSGQGLMAVSCVHGNEFHSFTIGGEFLNSLRGHYLCKKEGWIFRLMCFM